MSYPTTNSSTCSAFHNSLTFKSPLNTPSSIPTTDPFNDLPSTLNQPTSMSSHQQHNFINHQILLQQASSSNSYQLNHNNPDLSKFNIHPNNFSLPQHPNSNSNTSSSAPPHLSIFDFSAQDINLYDCLNPQNLPLSAPLPRSIDQNKHLSPLSLEDNSSAIPPSIHHRVDRQQIAQQANSFAFYPDPITRQSQPALSNPHGNLNQYSILPPQQPPSSSEITLALDQTHAVASSATAGTTTYPPNLIDLQSQPPLQSRLPLMDSIESHPSSFQTDKFDHNDIEPPPTSRALDLPSSSLQALFFNPQPKGENQLSLEPFTTAPISPFDQITPVEMSEKSNDVPGVQSRSPRLRFNRTTTSTLSQDFRKRKDWAKRLVEDIEDVLQVVQPTGELLFLSESMSRLTGFQTSELLGSKLFDWCFEDEDRVNLKRAIKNCLQYGNPLSLFCRFKKKDSDGFVILEMAGQMTDLKSTGEETGNTRVVYINGRPYPTSGGRLMDSVLELVIENEMMMKKLQSKEKELSEGEEREEEQRKEGEPDEAARRKKGKRRLSEPTKIEPIADEDDESEDEQDPSPECLTHQIIGRDYPSRPRKRPKKDKIDFLCLDCGVTQSPEWRKGPMGRKTLCNACGLRYAKKGQVVNSNTATLKKK